MLNGIQIGLIGNRIVDLYEKSDFKTFLFTRLDRRYQTLTADSTYVNEVTEILMRANHQGWVEQLLIALRAENPKNIDLTRLVFDLGIGIGAYNEQVETPILGSNALQNIVNATPYQNVAEILDGISFNKPCICRIEIPSSAGNRYGTGFLIGPDLILTNYHVVEPFILDKRLALSVICRFDYEAKSDGTIYYAGTEIKLHRHFKVAFSAYSQMDKDGTAGLNEIWPLDQLDYAVLKLEKRIGDEPVALQSRATANAPQRGWIKVAPGAALIPGGHLHIMQHPEGRPLQIAFGFEKLIGLSDNESRVRYQVNTLRGSSGSPCFNERFQWVAIHNLGDPAWVPSYNQGVAATTIIEHMTTTFNNVTFENNGFTSTT